MKGMNKREFVACVVALAISSLGNSTQANAADIAVNVGDGWHINSWNTNISTTLEDRYVLTDGSGVWIEIVDCCVIGDEFQVYNNGQILGQTTESDFNGPDLNLGEEDPWADGSYSWGSFELSPGAALVSFNLTKAAAGFAVGTNSVRFVTSPSRLMSRSGNSLRVDSLGEITAKEKIISCSPGTYKFLNLGSTEEAQNLEALIYTLVVDGKAVSRLGAGNYASLPSQLFPAITQSVFGSADMNGATWDVSALKNFDARCEIYAWQSGGNVQSSTAQISDDVKTAEIAAMAQAWEKQRAAATAANFTKEAREMRKRIATRLGN